MVLGIVCQRWTLSAPDSENRIILLQILGLNDSARISPTGVGCPVYSASHERLPQDERTTTCNFCVPDRLCNGHIVEAEALSLHPCPLTSVQTTGKSKAPWNSVATCVAVRNSCLPLTLLCSDVCKGRVQRYMQNIAGSFLEQWPWHSQTQTRWIMNKQPQDPQETSSGKVKSLEPLGEAWTS
jgi:hypothetical protein